MSDRIDSAMTRSKSRDEEFAGVVRLITAAKSRAARAVNTDLIELYWEIGKIISEKISRAEWGDGVVDQLASYIAQAHPALRGFTRANLFRMRQFYETYQNDVIVAPLVRLLPWSHNLIILGQAKRPEEREFYIRLAASEGWTRRELERQMKAALFERAILSPVKVSPPVRQMNADASSSIFKHSYVLEFLDLPPGHAEADLQRVSC
jgi:predicted nuclease of restriction endonuclease-like (RecB) superfamily